MIAACPVHRVLMLCGAASLQGATAADPAVARGRVANHGGEAQTAANISILQELTAYFAVGLGSGHLTHRLDGGQGRNRTTDTRIFSPLSLILGA